MAFEYQDIYRVKNLAHYRNYFIVIGDIGLFFVIPIIWMHIVKFYVKIWQKLNKDSMAQAWWKL